MWAADINTPVSEWIRSQKGHDRPSFTLVRMDPFSVRMDLLGTIEQQIHLDPFPGPFPRTRKDNILIYRKQKARIFWIRICFSHVNVKLMQLSLSARKEKLKAQVQTSTPCCPAL